MIIIFSGEKQSGKSTATSFLKDKDFVDIKMADPLKDMLRTLMKYKDLSDEYIERCLEGDLKEVPESKVFGNKTPRHAMQQLGTEWRNTIYTELWSDIWLYRINKDSKLNYCCSDVRFVHEIEAAKATGHSVYHVHIKRPSNSTGDSHASELSLEEYADCVIINDSSLEKYLEELKQVYDAIEVLEKLK